MSFWRVLKEQFHRKPEFLKQSAAEGIGMFVILWGLNKAGIIHPDTQHEKSFKELHQTPDTSKVRVTAGTREVR